MQHPLHPDYWTAIACPRLGETIPIAARVCTTKERRRLTHLNGGVLIVYVYLWACTSFFWEWCPNVLNRRRRAGGSDDRYEHLGRAHGIRRGNRTASSSVTNRSRQSSSQKYLFSPSDTNPRGPMTPCSKRRASTPRSRCRLQRAQRGGFGSSFSMMHRAASCLSSFARLRGDGWSRAEYQRDSPGSVDTS